MSRKRSEALNNLLLSYYGLVTFRANVSSGKIILTNTNNSETDLSKMVGFVKTGYYIKFIKQNFIDHPIKGNKISLKAIDEIVNNIKLFLGSDSSYQLQPITDIPTLHPYTLFEEISERITSTFESIFTTQQISPAPIQEILEEESIEHINAEKINNPIENRSENNNANAKQDDDSERYYTQDSATNLQQHFNTDINQDNNLGMYYIRNSATNLQQHLNMHTNQDDNSERYCIQEAETNWQQYLNISGRLEETDPIVHHSASSLSDFAY